MFKKTSLMIMLFFLLFSVSEINASVNPSYSQNFANSIDTVPFYPNGTYNNAITKPDDFFPEPIGFWPQRYHNLIAYITMLDKQSDRMHVEQIGFSHEGRPLYNIFISTPENIARLNEIKKFTSTLANPKKLNGSKELESYTQSMPAVAWLGYSIHGDEISGVDAGIQLVYQLTAGTDSATIHLLENVLIIIDPSENPDGRERYLSMLTSYRSSVPNYDRRAQQHQGVWPWGRGNHYLFDLNRDWIFLTQPETIKRTRTILDWHPQLVVDAHEMGTNATYLFTPPRQPINYNTPKNIYKWWDIFSKDQGAAFDKNGWPYYIEEWHEQWYPGYGSAWPTFTGTIGILYEQAGVDGTMVKQRDGYLLSYHESVNHQFTSSLSNLFSLANNRVEILKDYSRTRKQIVTDGKKSNIAFLFVSDGDEIKMNRFISSLAQQDIIIEEAITNFTVSQSTDIYGVKHKSKKFPQGTFIIHTTQAHGALAKAILEFDPHFKLEFLNEERREIEKYSGSKMYEVTSWSAPLAYNLDAYETKSQIKVATRIVKSTTLSTGELKRPNAQFGFIVNMEGEKTYQLLNLLFENKIVVYGSEKEFTLEGNKYKAGSLVIRTRGNDKNLSSKLKTLAKQIGITINGVNTGFSSAGSLLGAGTYKLLTQPKIALLSGNGVSNTSFGSLWFTIDKELKMPHSLINAANLSYTDLSQYNVLIMASSWGNSIGGILGKSGKNKIDKWVSDGGTLIAVGGSAVWAADSSTGLSQVKLKRQVLTDLASYDKILDKAMRAESPTVDTMALYHPTDEAIVKKEDDKKKSAPKNDATELDEWQRKFLPRGAFLKLNLDKDNFLTFGLGKTLPAQLYTSYALMAKPPVKVAARLSSKKSDLRLSGLLWPEAQERWKGTGYATTESHGKGQIILFAGDPNSRAYFYGTRQMFVNALMYGPGFGTRFESSNNQSANEFNQEH